MPTHAGPVCPRCGVLLSVNHCQPGTCNGTAVQQDYQQRMLVATEEYRRAMDVKNFLRPGDSVRRVFVTARSMPIDIVGEPSGHGLIVDVPASLDGFLAWLSASRERVRVNPPGPDGHPELWNLHAENDYD